MRYPHTLSASVFLLLALCSCSQSERCDGNAILYLNGKRYLPSSWEYLGPLELGGGIPALVAFNPSKSLLLTCDPSAGIATLYNLHDRKIINIVHFASRLWADRFEVAPLPDAEHIAWSTSVPDSRSFFNLNVTRMTDGTSQEVCLPLPEGIGLPDIVALTDELIFVCGYGNASASLLCNWKTREVVKKVPNIYGIIDVDRQLHLVIQEAAPCGIAISKWPEMEVLYESNRMYNPQIECPPHFISGSEKLMQREYPMRIWRLQDFSEMGRIFYDKRDASPAVECYPFYGGRYVWVKYLGGESKGVSYMVEYDIENFKAVRIVEWHSKIRDIVFSPQGRYMLIIYYGEHSPSELFVNKLIPESPVLDQHREKGKSGGGDGIQSEGERDQGR